jgi:WD40 repeat protein
MQKMVRITLLALMVFLAGCRTATPTALPTAVFTQTPASTQTPAPSATPMARETGAPTLAPTDTPEPSPTAVITADTCVAADGVPLAFLADNDHLLYELVAEGESGLKIVDLATRESEDFLPPSDMAGQQGTVVAVSPAGDRLALALNNDNTIRIYQVSDRKLLHTLIGHTDIITELEFSPDGKKLYSASHDSWVRVWDQDGKAIGSFQPTGADNFPGQVLGMGLSPDGKLLATIPFDGKTKLWDAQTFAQAPRAVRELGAFGGYDNSDAWFSPDGQYLAAITANGLFLWKVADGTQLMGGNPGINAMAAAWTPDNELVYWDVQGNNELTFVSEDGSKQIRNLPAATPVWSISFSPDGSLMVAASNIETRIWHVGDWKWLYVMKAECP